MADQWRIEDFAIVNAAGRRLFWAGYATSRGCSMKVDEAEKAKALQLARAAPELREALELLHGFVLDLLDSNPGIIGRACLQEYDRFNMALIKAPQALAAAKGEG